MATTKEIPENKKAAKTEAKAEKVPKEPKAKKVGKTFRSLPDDVRNERMDKILALAKEINPEGEGFAISCIGQTRHREYVKGKK
jgi:hypothetical protein